MKETPILFSGPMVRAILDGRKTQTRRVVPGVDSSVERLLNPWVNGVGTWTRRMCGDDPGPFVHCRYGGPGDRLWVRETWAKCNCNRNCGGLYFRADDGHHNCGANHSEWRPSIHMPRWASRITLEVIKVRVERVQEISESDAEAEGIAFIRDFPDADETLTARQLFEVLWDSINAKRGFGWSVNPWVWVLEFRRIA